MNERTMVPYAALLLRLMLGGLFLAHFALKAFVFTPAGTAKFFASLGLPAELAYLTMAVELFGGLALLAGVFTRVAAIVTIPVLLGAILTVHIHAGFFFTDPNGGWEFPGLWMGALVVQALLGDGAFALASRLRAVKLAGPRLA